VLGLEAIDVTATLLVAAALAVSVAGAFALARVTTEHA
jgi:hypothetical protein